MATAGSILGNAVQRLEDPTLLTGAGKYVDDMAPAGCSTSRSSARRSPTRTSYRGRRLARRSRCPASMAVYHARGDDLGHAVVPGLPDDAADR